MKQALTAKLKLIATPEQAEALRAVGNAYLDAANFASRIAFDLDKTTNAALLHKSVYQIARSEYGLPSQLACSVNRYVTAAYKTLWSKAKANKKARKLGQTKRLYKGLNKAPKFHSPTVPYQYGYDYSFKSGQQVSIITLQGRLKLGYLGWNPHIEMIQDKATRIGGSKLWYDRQTKVYYLLVSLEVELPDPLPTDHKLVVGVDVGQRYLAVATDTHNNTHFTSGKQALHKARQNQKTRRNLQKKLRHHKKQRHGTRSVSRRLIGVSQRERRHKQSLNHSTAKKIIERFPNAIIGMEDLTNVRERTNRSTSKKASKKQKKANGQQAKWAFAELQGYIAYKATLAGCMTIKVDAHYTSQSCPSCGHISKGNRPGKGLLFVCENCSFALHADLVGGRNIALRTLMARQDWAITGCLSTSPSRSAGDASDVETKTARLQKYAGLRWSPEAKVEELIR